MNLADRPGLSEYYYRTSLRFSIFSIVMLLMFVVSTNFESWFSVLLSILFFVASVSSLVFVVKIKFDSTFF